MLAVDILTESVHPIYQIRVCGYFGDIWWAAGALFLDVYRICGVTETGQEYLYDLLLWSVTFVADFPVREQAKLAPESGERLGKFGALLQQTGEAIDGLIEPGHMLFFTNLVTINIVNFMIDAVFYTM